MHLHQFDFDVQRHTLLPNQYRLRLVPALHVQIVRAPVNINLFHDTVTTLLRSLPQLKPSTARIQGILAMAKQEDDPPRKRRKLNTNLLNEVAATGNPHSLHGLDRPISPPLSRRKSPVVPNSVLTPTWGFDDVPKPTGTPASPYLDVEQVRAKERDSLDKRCPSYVPSPVQLTRIEDLAPHQNVDAVGLKDILGSPMIKECWNFNFLFDIDFVM